jgi:D-aspartate ligase
MKLRHTALPVLVLQMQHHGALGVMRSLGRLGVRVYGIHRTRRPAASFSRYCQKVFVLDLDRTPAQQSVDCLTDIARSLGAMPLLIPTNDETALYVAQNVSTLQEAFLFPVNSLQVVWSLYNKKAMYHLAKRLSIPTPETVFPQCRKDVLEFCEKGQFPVMLKASDNINTSRRAGKKMVIARSQDELISQYEAMEDGSNPSLMIQEYIPGDDDSVWMFNGYFDENSECLFGVTAKKIHQTPVYTGMTALGICLPNPVVESATKTLVRAVGYKGILDIGYRYDARDGLHKLLDANPRLGATFRLFVGDNGMDVTRAEYLHFTGQPVPASNIRTGRKWILEDADLRSCIRYHQDGVLTFQDWLASYRGIQECAWYAADDILPFLRMCSSFSIRPFRKIFRKARAAFASGLGSVVQNATPRTAQESVNDYFTSTAAYWKNIYSDNRLLPAIYQDRRNTALGWISALDLRPNARILEVGCGAGLTSIALAQSGYTVDALDSTALMLQLARNDAVEQGVQDRIQLLSGDVHALPFQPQTFDLVIALGVIPWLHSELVALQEMQRVLKPGGYLLVTADNNARLNRILDPLSSPLLAPFRLAAKSFLKACGLSSPNSKFQPRRHYPREVNRMIAECSFTNVKSCTVGFGPFTLFGKTLLTDWIGVVLHRWLQAHASKRRLSPLRWTGSHYLVLATKVSE